MAGNLRYVATQMHKNGDDFGDITSVKTSVVKYVSQYTNDQSISVEEVERTLHGRRYLTPIQLVFLEKIRKAQFQSRTVDEFTQHLKQVIEEIQVTVPEIQQRNLLKMTVALYYLTKEIDSLLKEGLMPVDLHRPQHIRLRSGDEINGIMAAMLAGICIAADEVAAGILASLRVAVMAAGSTLLVIGGCLLLVGLTGDTEINKAYCQENFNKCTETSLGNPGTGGPGSTMCGKCLEFCLVQGYWECPRPH